MSKRLQLTPNGSFQPIRGAVLAAGAVPQRWRSALWGASEPPVRDRRSEDVSREIRELRSSDIVPTIELWSAADGIELDSSDTSEALEAFIGRNPVARRPPCTRVCCNPPPNIAEADGRWRVRRFPSGSTPLPRWAILRCCPYIPTREQTNGSCSLVDADPEILGGTPVFAGTRASANLDGACENPENSWFVRARTNPSSGVERRPGRGGLS